MPLYEGTTLILEKQAVVLDLGTKYTKFGFTGEASPRCIIRSEFLCERTNEIRQLYDYKTEDELRDNLVQMLHLLYFRHVLVNPKDRKVVVVEWLLTPTLFRETLAKVLYLHYEVSAVVWAPSPLMCRVTVESPAALLVVELGWRESSVCAVVHGVPVLHAMVSVPLAASAVHENLLSILRDDNPGMQELPEHVVEDIKVKCCFVTTLARAQQHATRSPPAPVPAARYPHRGATVAVSARARELAAECLFATDNEHASLAESVLHTIVKCPVDTRKPLAENILLTGGTAMLTGIKSRVAEELKYHLTQPHFADKLYLDTFKFHSAPAKDNYTAWLGGSIVGATDALSTRALPRDTYFLERRVKDWVNLLDTTPPNHPLWSAMSL